MKKLSLFLVFVLIIVILFFVSLIGTENPAKMTQAFYDKLLASEGYIGNNEYRNFSELSPEYIALVDSIIASSDQGGFDPFLCAQDKPESVSTKLVEVTKDTAFVSVTEVFSEASNDINVRLTKSKSGWKINNIECGNRGSANSGDLNKVGDYISANISSLAPIKETVGGKFFITTISLKKGGGIMNYEDGHNAYSATFDYKVENSLVSVSNIKLIDIAVAPSGTDFDKTGNLTKPEGKTDWVFVYEETGKPALSKDLMITEDSVCISGQDIVYCNSSTLNSGDRVSIQGKIVNGKVQVFRIIKK